VVAIAVSYSGLLGGAERVLVEVASGLEEPPLIACPPGTLADAARSRGIGVFELRERSPELRRSPTERAAAAARLAAQAAELRSLFASVRPDTVVAWGMRAALTSFPAAGRDTRLVLQHNDLLPGPLIARALRRRARRADLVVVPSHCVARDLDPYGELREQLRVVKPGVDLERFRPATAPAEDPHVLLLGAIEPWKRPDVALEAVALAARELPEIRLTVVGEPVGAEGERLLGELHRRAERHDLRGRVTFAGRVSEPERLLSSAACLLHCAEREPYGMVIAEALACGMPVVAPDSCGPGELLDRDCGRLYKPGNPAAAARGLSQILDNAATRVSMGAAARARAERDLGLSAMRAAYGGLLSVRAGVRRPGAELAVVTVLHDSVSQLERLLDSLDRHLPAAQLVVVDSGSSDGGVELARAWRAGSADVVVLGENQGFGRSVAAGLPLVRRPVTALLNPDVELLDASLAALAREAMRGPERLLVPLVERADGSREDNAQPEPGAPSLLVHALVPGALLPSGLAAALEPWRARRPRRAGWPVASCLVARTETLRRLGPFDEQVFMYAEDLDLGLRASDAGVETWFWPAARVRHTGAHASGPAFGGEPFDLLARRRREVVRERRGPGRARRDDLLQLLTFADRLALKRLRGRDAARERRQLAALLRARRAGGR
jgi:glycosyltransferase involved in cell wall biosynthesis/GT2 family glycosyltransferase